MFTRQRSRKAIAATLLLVFFTQTFAPTISYALTSGPTQPEATSFEPIDTTDVVNLQTGGFVYNVPLLEVPGPDGGYPLSLSYHSGIQTNVDASWVGLGWTVNPGSIDRSVNGYPDDWGETNTTVHNYWSGGKTTTYTVGISIGIANVATVGADLSFAHDTYKGFGVGGDLSASLGFRFSNANNVNIGASLGIGVAPYGGTYIDGGLGLSIGLGGNFKATLGVGFTTNFKTLSVGFSAKVGYSAQYGDACNPNEVPSSMGVTIGSGGGKPSPEIGGLSETVSNSSSGQMSTSSRGFHADIPVWWGINLSLGYSKVRYWTDETTQIATWGSLGGLGTGYSQGKTLDNNSWDEYSLLEYPTYENIVDDPDPTTVQGGSFPNFDSYNVQCQGLGGSMRPYVFQAGIMNQNIYNGSTPEVIYYSNGPTQYPAIFRFDNDFSNSYQQAYPDYFDTTLNVLAAVPPMATAVTGDNDGTYGFAGGNLLAGSKHVDIGPLIHPRQALGYNKSDRWSSGMVEGFSITNENGMTYHFGLPAYSFNEQDYQEKIDQSQGATGNRQTRPSPYAYTWYLTTITGPDFVDRNGDGIADDGDWGYWVDFEYGKWDNEYNWRNPAVGFNSDEDNQWHTVGMGTREIYYLNAIRTRSHIALFEKNIRYDAKGASPEIFNTVSSGNITSAGYANQGVYNANSGQSLALTHVYILNARDENFVTPSSGNPTAYQPITGRNIACPDCELASNVLDSTDVAAVGRANLEAKAIRVIDFDYNYSLCQGTTNSYDINNAGTLQGKLTLANLVTRGKGGSNLIPPMQFTYEMSGSTLSGVTLSPTNFTTTNGEFNIGDMIMESASPNVYCGVIIAKTVTSGTYTYTLANGNYTGGTITATVFRTKNPPYNPNAYDEWGAYKSDYISSAITSNPNVGFMTTPCSEAGTDAWSLRAITTQLGSTINVGYESGQIGSSGTYSPLPFIINGATLDGGAYNKVVFSANTYDFPLSDFWQVGSTCNLLLWLAYPGGNWAYEPWSGTCFVTSIDAANYIHVTLSSPIPQYSPVYNDGFGWIISGNISGGSVATLYGGGTRVNNISSNNFDGTQNITAYNYNNPQNNLSSGVTSYMPSNLDVFDKATLDNSSQENGLPQDVFYQRVLYQNLNQIYALSRELPPPGVMYAYVTVTDEIKNPDEASTRVIEGSTQYNFETFNPDMVGITDVNPRSGPAVESYGNVFTRNLVLQKFTNCIGNLKSVTHFDPNGRPLSKTVNHYLHDGLIGLPETQLMSAYKTLLANYGYQGFLQERYSEVKQVSNQAVTQNNGIKGTLSARESYPCIQTGQTTIDYVNGMQTSSTNLGYDYYSGAVTETVETDAYGNNFLTQTIPAYREYPSMGLKNISESYKNMLTQAAESYRWKVDANNNKLGLISASVTTWSDGFTVMDPSGNTYTQNAASGSTGDAWRQQSTYQYLPAAQTTDGTTPYANFNDFDWAAPGSSDPAWKNTSTTTRYDVYSKPMEMKDINGIYATRKMDYNDQRVVLTGNAANFYEIAFSGAEDANISQTNAMFVNGGAGTVTTAAAHTGAQSLLLASSGTKGFTYSVPTNNLVAGRTYQASVWVKPVSGISNVGLYYDINGTIKHSFSSANSTKTGLSGWVLVNLIINGSDITAGNTLNVWCRNDNGTTQAYVDDFRFQPVSSSTSAYVYDPFSGELDYVLDNSNFFTEYVYDAVGRLLKVIRENMGNNQYISKQYQYNYGTGLYYNAAITSVNYTKNNCGPDQIPSTISVSVPAKMFNSFLSLADANAKAVAYAQDYANVNGTCTCAPSFAFASGITVTENQFSETAPNITYALVFTWPAGYTTVNLGNVVGPCAYPTSTRTIPYLQGSTVYNLTVSATGAVAVTIVSGSAPTGTIGFTGVYNINQNAYYSDPESGSFQRTNCGSGYTGSYVTYSIPQYAYNSLTSQAAADQLAINAMNAAGPTNANQNGTCTANCSFTWASGLNPYSATIGSSGTTGSFSIDFLPTTNGWSSGTLGTIVGSACLPTTTQNVYVTDGSNSSRTWQVTIATNGTVSVMQQGGPATTTQGAPIQLKGTYTD